MRRREFLALTGGAALAVAGARSAYANWAPTKPVRVIVPYGTGGGTDIVARLLADVVSNNHLSPERWVVENRTGGGGMVGMEALRSGKGDNNLIGILTSTNMTTPLLQPNVGLNWSQLTPIANLVVDIQYLATSTKSGYKTLDDVMKAAKERPGELRIAGAAIGTEDHLTTLMMEQATGTKFTYLPHQNGGAAKTALAGGHVPVAFLNPSEMAGFLTSDGGTIFPIAVAWGERTPEFPDVPTFKERGYDVVFDAFFRGVFGPPDMPEDVRSFYADVVAKAVNEPEWNKRVKEMLVSPVYVATDKYKQALIGWEKTISALMPLVGSTN